jgi:hypothetical protein
MDKKNSDPIFCCDRAKVAILAIISNHICHSDDVPTTRRRGAADEVVHAEEEEVRDRGRM